MQNADKYDKIIKEGWLSKQSRFLRQWRQRWFVLTPTNLYTFKEERKYTNPTETITLKDLTTVKSAESEIHKENAFKLESSNFEFFMLANSGSEKESWIGAIGKAMVAPTLSHDDE